MDVKIVNFCGPAKLTDMQAPSHQSLKMRHRLLMTLFLVSLAAVVASNWWFANQVSTVVKILLGAVCLALFVATSIYARKLRKNLSQAQAESAQAAQLLCDHPALIKRPVIDRGNALRVGFPAKQADEIISWLQQG